MFVAGSPPVFQRSLGGFAFERVTGSGAGEQIGFSPQIGDMDGDGKLDVVTSGSLGPFAPDGYFIRYALGPELVAGVVEVDFGFVTLGSRAPGRSVVFRNDGPGTASDIQRDMAGAVAEYPIESDSCSGATLTVGQTCAFTFGFAPSVAGDHEAAVTAYAPDADYVNGVTLFGTCVAPAAPGAPGAPGTPGTPPPPAASPPPPPPASPRRLGKPVVTATTLAVLGRRGLRFTQRLPAAGRARWTLEIPAVGRRKRVVIGQATRTVTKSGVVRVTIRPTASAVRLLAAAGYAGSRCAAPCGSRATPPDPPHLQRAAAALTAGATAAASRGRAGRPTHCDRRPSSRS